MILLSLVLLAPPQSAIVADPAAPASTIAIATDTWSTAAGPSFAVDVAAMVLRDSPTEELTASLAVGTDNALWLSTFDGAAWSTPASITTDTGDTTTFDAAFEPASGRLLIVYRKGTSSLIYSRTLDGDSGLSSEDWFDLALPAAPDRVLLVPKPGSNEMVLVALSGSTVRAAIWDSDSFTDSTTLDTGFDGAPEAIAAEWRKKDAFVLWARSTDTSPRGSVFDGAFWNTAAGLPTLPSPIARLSLTPSNDRAGSPLLLTTVTDTGVSLGLHAATLDNDGWTAPTTLTTQLINPEAFSAAWETSGTAAVALWQDDTQSSLQTARWDSVAWSAATPTDDLGGTVARMVTRPGSQISDGVHTLVSVSSTAPALEDYLVYASAGSLDLGTATVVNGVAGSGAGHTLPTPPAVTPGTTPVTLGNNKTVSLSPGNYAAVSIGNRSTLELVAGSYVFASMSPGNNQFTLNADTTAGPIALTIAAGNFDAKNKLTVSTTGPGPFEIHLLNGDFIASNTPAINASVIAHQGDITLGNSASTQAHLIASGNVTVGNASTLDPPAWGSPFVDPSPIATSTTTLVALTTTAGTPGTPITLSTGWSHAQEMPFDLSWQRPATGLRITSWREVPSYDD